MTGRFVRDAAMLVALAAPALLIAADGRDWPMHHGDLAGQRHSSLKQITTANVATVRKAWTYDTGAAPLQTTPIVAGGVMYLSGGRNVFALEPESGRQLWKYTAPAPVSRRGVAYWPGDGTVAARIFTGAGDRLIA